MYKNVFILFSYLTDSSGTILKEVSPEYSLEGLILKLKFQYLATWCRELTHLKRPWCWERLKARGEGDDRGWDGWMASPTQWTWVWASSGSWWWTGRPGVLQSMGSQRVWHDWATELTLVQYCRLQMTFLWNFEKQCLVVFQHLVQSQMPSNSLSF